MATIQRFEDLKIWQKARLYSLSIFELTGSGEFYADYDHRRQIRRSADSVMDNIAEGFGRGSRGEFIQFLGIAKGSLTEVKSQLYRALDRKYLSLQAFEKTYEEADELGKMIAGFISYLSRTQIKGSKYKQVSEKSEVKEPEINYENWFESTVNRKQLTEN
ncbi:four helix bundle protein [Siphonobacter sp. SORGH_AS_0500]|uniref:four helix bundle protein n=1 Tax=Siphonobacter sp. SORGH_AS_0500 TaxID=1864824 RepID=UPI000CC1653D|nr:four helix bundle protein [Siphonobacter sp. SORGH_AS_0500]MDR6196200.1 four helix bundle protein [Siphonobacter sp. SORGH_AS_0500]PKK38177.1 hypothetical protein BWI96_03655 [Siphonobacter sp. SORGH_AS_0500]